MQAYLADKAPTPRCRGAAAAAWEFRKVLAARRDERDKLAAQETELRSATEETRGNLKALEKNTAAADLRAKLTAAWPDGRAPGRDRQAHHRGRFAGQ